MTEGVRYQAYADPASPRAVESRKPAAQRRPGWSRLSGAPWTICYGHTKGVREAADLGGLSALMAAGLGERMKFRSVLLGLTLPFLMGAAIATDIEAENQQLRAALVDARGQVAALRIELALQEANCAMDAAAAAADAEHLRSRPD